MGSWGVPLTTDGELGVALITDEELGVPLIADGELGRSAGNCWGVEAFRCQWLKRWVSRW